MSRILYLVSDSRLLNPKLSAELEAEDYATDPESAIADWGGGFRSDESQAFADADIDYAVVPTQRSVASSRDREYYAFADLSGGRHDSAALGIAHKESNRVIVDRVEVIPSPHDPKQAIARFADICRGYWVDRVTADNYGGEIIVSEFASHGITLTKSDLTASEIYQQAMPLFTARILDLPDVPRLITELRQLERRPRSRGGDQITHPRKGMDDVANAALGAAVKASSQRWSGAYSDDLQAGRHIRGTDYSPFTRFAEQLERNDAKRR